ncbi:MAG: hypothetical protein ABI770_03405 [Sphingomicrobium sp.]
MIGIVILSLAAASPILPGLQVGQSIEFVSRIDCQITSDQFDLNGTAHSSRLAGADLITFLFPAPPADDPKAKYAPIIPVVELDTSSDGSTYLFNVEARANAVPIVSATSQLSIVLNEGEGRWMTLTPRDGSNNRNWEFESTQVAVHGATITEKGICKLKSQADPR